LPNDYDVCNRRGTCVGKDECECDPGYKGSQCQFVINPEYLCLGYDGTDEEVCYGRGNCIDDECESGFIGFYCDIVVQCYGFDVFDPRVCSGHGLCLRSDYCSCRGNWIGDNCEVLISD